MSTYVKQITNSSEGRNRQQYNNLGDFKIPLQQWVIQTEQKEILDLNDTLDQIDLIGTTEHFISSRMHILLRHTWNILQDRSIFKPKNKS